MSRSGGWLVRSEGEWRMGGRGGQLFGPVERAPRGCKIRRNVLETSGCSLGGAALRAPGPRWGARGGGRWTHVRGRNKRSRGLAPPGLSAGVRGQLPPPLPRESVPAASHCPGEEGGGQLVWEAAASLGWELAAGGGVGESLASESLLSWEWELGGRWGVSQPSASVCPVETWVFPRNWVAFPGVLVPPAPEVAWVVW